MNAMVDDERDDKGITSDEVANDDALGRADDGVRNVADDLDASLDAARVRDALAAHPWPVAGEALMARLHAVPATAASPPTDAAPASSTAPDRDDRGRMAAPAARRTDRQGRDSGRRLRRPRTPVELAAAFAVVAAVVVVLTRGAGDLAPVSDPGAADAAATRTAEARAADAIATRTPEAGALTANTAVDPGEGRGEAGDPTGPLATAGPVATAPLPPAGTRLYGSVADLVADPPPAGETVWVDAYHGERINARLDLVFEERINDCPSAPSSVLLDKPFLGELNAFNTVQTVLPTADDGPWLIAAGLDADGGITPDPDLPRHGRLVLHLGDPGLEACDDAGRIVLVERVAYVFEPKPDWAAMHEAIRRSETVGWYDGAEDLPSPDWLDIDYFKWYRMAIPDGLALSAPSAGHGPNPSATPVEDAATEPWAMLTQADVPDHPIIVSSWRPGDPGYVERWRHLPEGGGLATQAMVTESGVRFAIERDFEEPERRTIRAFTLVRGDLFERSLFEFTVALPEDPIAAQPLLWRFEAVVDRFQSSGRDAATPLVAEPEPTVHPCPTRSVPVPLPTSTAYDEDDVMNDLVTTGFGLADLARDPAIIVSATVGAVVQRTSMRFVPPTVDATVPFALPPGPVLHTLWQPITVREVLKGADRVAPGETLMLQVPDPADCAMFVDCDRGRSGMDVEDEGATYLFFLEDPTPIDQRRGTMRVEAEPGPDGPSFTVYRGAFGRLLVTYDRVRYSTRERHRTEFARDMTGCAFLEELRQEIRRVGAGR